MKILKDDKPLIEAALRDRIEKLRGFSEHSFTPAYMQTAYTEEAQRLSDFLQAMNNGLGSVNQLPRERVESDTPPAYDLNDDIPF